MNSRLRSSEMLILSPVEVLDGAHLNNGELPHVPDVDQTLSLEIEWVEERASAEPVAAGGDSLPGDDNELAVATIDKTAALAKLSAESAIRAITGEDVTTDLQVTGKTIRPAGTALAGIVRSRHYFN